MKHIRLLLFISFTIALVSCELDNFHKPESVLSGRFVYNEQPLQLRGTAGDWDNMIYAYQYGPAYENIGGINIYCNSDGEFRNLMYNGNYKLVLRQDRGPWIPMKDTIEVSISGNYNLDIEVTPYFIITQCDITYHNNVVKVKCQIDKIVEDAQIQDVVLYISSTKLVDNVAKIAEKSFANISPGITEFEFDLTNNGITDAAHYLFARVGVRAINTNEYIFSEIQKLR